VETKWDPIECTLCPLSAHFVIPLYVLYWPDDGPFAAETFCPNVKGRKAGVYSALQLEEADCTLTPWRSFLIHLQRCHHTKWRESPLLAKEGTFIEGILLAIRNLLQLLGSFTCRKFGTWDRLFNFPSEGRHAEDFVHGKNPTASARFEPANSGTRGQHANH
jgi:hypothetical protein